MYSMERWPAWARPAALAALVCAIYLPYIGNSFVSLDDGLLITRNPAVQQLTLRSVAHVFSTYDPELYVPLTLLSYQVEHALFGLNPMVFHFTNVLLHALSTLLVYVAAGRLLRSNGAGFAVAALFAVHPLQSEAVLWAAARKDLLSSFFFLGSLTLYLQYRETDEKRTYWLSVFAFALGLLSKVSIILLPLILLLCDRLQGRPWSKEILREKVPYAVLSLVFGVIALGGKSGAIAGIGPMETLLLGAKNAAFMLGKAFWPSALSVIYPQLTPVAWTPEFLVPVVIVTLLAAAAWVLRRRWPPVSFGIVFFLLMLLPSFGTFYKNGFLFFASDRYAYLAVLGIFCSVAWGLLHLPRKVAALLGAGLVGAFMIVSVGRGAVWKSSAALYQNVIASYPQSAMAHNNLGDALKETDKTAAEEEFQKALSLQSDLVAAHVNIALLRMEEGKNTEAIASLRAAKEFLADTEELTIDEIPVLYYLGQALEASGDAVGSLKEFQEAATRAPALAEPQYNLGLQYQKRGRAAEAIEAFSRATERDPFLVDGFYRLAALEAGRGKLDAAVTALEEVLRIDPNHAKAPEHLANIRNLRGR